MWYENLNVLSVIGMVILALIVVVVLLFKGKKEEAKKIALSLVIDAENRFGNGTGSLKYAYVLGLIYPKLPVVIRLFVSESTLDTIIEESVTLLKKDLQPIVSTTPQIEPSNTPVEEAKVETEPTPSIELGVVPQPVNEVVEAPVVDEIPVDTKPVVVPSSDDIKASIDALVSSKVSDAVDLAIDLVSSKVKSDTISSIISGISTI